MNFAPLMNKTGSGFLQRVIACDRTTMLGFEGLMNSLRQEGFTEKTALEFQSAAQLRIKQLYGSAIQ
jgi:hypothetical protein